jgi:hypothetical protein
VGEALLFDGVPEGGGDVILTHHVCESLRSIFPGKNRVTHPDNLEGSVFRANKISVSFF